MYKPSRRDFIKAVPLTALAAGCGPAPYRRGDFVVPAQSPMAILPASSYDASLTDVISRGLDLLGQDVRGKRVFLKPNLVEYEADTTINTDPRVVAAAAEAFLKAGAAEVVVGEGPGHRRDLEYLLEGTGLDHFLSDLKVRFVDLNHDDVREVPLKSHFMRLETLWLPTSLLQADFVVSMPKLKTHHWAGLTVSMKNLFGTIPGAVYGWPKNLLHVRGIDNSIVDIAATVKPHFTIVDAIVAMEGDGPIMGRPRTMGFLAMGADLPAVDATCARIIGLDPAKIPYLSMAGEFLGNTREKKVEQRGEKLSRYHTQFDVVERIRGLRL